MNIGTVLAHNLGMPLLRLLILVGLVVQLAPQVRAETGGNHGGGGDDYIADFRAKAEFLIENYFGFSDKERKLLKKSLGCEIKTVAVLKNPVTGAPIEEKIKIAWGSPGLIQLKLDDAADAAGEDSWQKVVREKRPIAQHMIHELYRCSNPDEYRAVHNEYAQTGQLAKYDDRFAPDEGYSLSVGIHHLQNEPVLTSKDISSFECELKAWGRRGKHESWDEPIPNSKRNFGFVPDGKYYDIKNNMYDFGRFHFWFLPSRSNQGIRIKSVGIQYRDVNFRSVFANQTVSLILPDDQTSFEQALGTTYGGGMPALTPAQLGIDGHDGDVLQNIRLVCTPKYLPN